MDWGGANSRFLGLVSVWAARSFDQTALRPSVIKRIRQIDVKYITHITSFGVTAWTRVTAWTCMCELPRCTVHWTRISIHWILDFKQLLLLLTSDVPGIYRAGILCSRPWIRMYVARHQKEQELGTARSSTLRLCSRIEDNFSRCELTRGRKPAYTISRLSG